jgi:prophage regulatory protein
MAIKIFRLNELLPLRGISRSTHYLELSRGLWTRPIRLSMRSRGWPAYEVEALIEARIAGETDEGIRTLVEKLEASRGNIKAVISGAAR